MRRYTQNGEERLWYDPREIEELMAAELSRASLSPTAAAPAVEIERFVEKHLGVRLDQYAELEDEILGATEFVQGAAPRILINKDLTNSALDEDDPLPGREGRWRATLAHEAAHVILHRCLYDVDNRTLDLFGHDGSSVPTRLHRCPKQQVAYRQRRNWDWREVQANKGMAALLMPRAAFGELAQREIDGAYAAEFCSSQEAISVAARLAEAFSVSKQAARIRLETLGFVQVAGQSRL